MARHDATLGFAKEVAEAQSDILVARVNPKSAPTEM